MSFFTREEQALLYRANYCPQDDFLPYGSSPNLTVMGALVMLMSEKQSHFNHLTKSVNDTSSPSRRAEDILNSVVVTVICAFGAVGNVINLIILSHRSWQVALGRMERFVQSGLIALAVSDLCYCVSLLPMIMVDQHDVYTSYNFHIFYLAYCNGFINTFALCSTILTVTIAIGRYFATVHPIRARERFGMTFAKRILLTVFGSCVVLNIPRYFFKDIQTVTCINEPTNSIYYFDHDYLPHTYRVVYLCIYFVVAICIPFAILAYCNIYLVKALKQSVSSPIVRRRTKTKHEPGSYRITLTLVIIVMAFFVCVVPTETLVFWKTLSSESGENVDKYNVAVAVLTCVSAVNFSFNFILYCVVNSHFRRTIYDILRCHFRRLARRKGSFRNESGTMSSGPNGNHTGNNYHGAIHMTSRSGPRKTSVTEL